MFILRLFAVCISIKTVFFIFFFIFLDRRTRAAIAKPALNTTDASKMNAIDSITLNDQHFASPKRKDCKLDTNLLSSMTSERATKSTTNSTTTIMNGKKSGKTAKKQAQSITKYFHNSDEYNNEFANVKDDIQSNADTKPSESNTTLPMNNNKSDEGTNLENNITEQKPSTDAIHNGQVLLSPDAKASLLNGVKQTTPHRIVCHSSPTKKQRLYVKSPVKDPAKSFSSLNIRDAASPKAKTNRKKDQLKSRRKLNVENCENGDSVTNGSVHSDATTLSNGDASASKTDEQNAVNQNNEFKLPNGTAPRRVHDTLLTQFFPIRRSVRKTKKAVEQEQSRSIEIAIEKQLEDGLDVEMFEGKGRGIVAARPFQRGEFVVEYIGELIDQTEADRREEEYARNADFGCYMYYFKHKEQQWW